MGVFFLSVPIIKSIKKEDKQAEKTYIRTDEKKSAEEETDRHISIANKSGVSLWTER